MVLVHSAKNKKYSKEHISVNKMSALSSKMYIITSYTFEVHWGLFAFKKQQKYNDDAYPSQQSTRKGPVTQNWVQLGLSFCLICTEESHNAARRSSLSTKRLFKGCIITPYIAWALLRLCFFIATQTAQVVQSMLFNGLGNLGNLGSKNETQPVLFL